MGKRSIDLAVMPYDVMLVVEHPSGVVYRNQVGGVLCFQEELEGVLGPLDFDDADVEKIMNLPYDPGRGLGVEIADAVDAILAANARTRYVKVDRERLHESFEAWVFVQAETEDDTPDHLARGYFGSIFGFGRTRAVLTWLNSD